MQNPNTKITTKKARFTKRALALLLLTALLMQIFAVCCYAATDGAPIIPTGSRENGTTSSGGIGRFDSDETIAQLKKDFLGSINKDLIKKIEDYQLKGEVGAIISFSSDSLISSYASSGSVNTTFGEYRLSEAAQIKKNRLAKNQTAVLEALMSAELISEVKYNYYNIMDGAYVSTTYENIKALCDFAGVERVIISNSYKPMAAVENPVDVYETGIFNSSDISYTGEHTIVAILDTGCDYTHTAFTTHTVVNPRYDRDDIAARLEKLVAYSYDTSLEAREVYYGNITGGKIAFGYDYADKDPDVMPFSDSHGTHVAGVIGGKDDVITGVAIDTQFAIMKVFSDYDQGAKDGDIFAALEDAVTLEVDAINMSLGTSSGFTREVDEEFKNEIYDKIEAAGISLVVAASNDFSSAFGSEHGNTNKTDNPDSATVGSPSTYDSAMSVASINGNKDKYMVANGNLEVFFHEAVNQASEDYDFFAMLGVSKDNPIVEFEYVTIPGLGYAINYSGLDLEGKIALVRRGDITFEEKVQFAEEAGAAGIIVYNNIFGDIVMTVGNDLKIPTISIGKDEGDAMAAHPTGKLLFNYNNLAGPFMSDFSSWGPTPDLKLKPEITAHGGNILSAIPGGEYEELSGTSMAAPNMTGITVLIRQYVIEKYPDLPVTAVRDLVNQLCMSTATIALDRNGNPYSPRKQGAGIADIARATTTPAYLYALKDGTGKTKLELGDDPQRSGVYTMTVYLKNISDTTLSYKLGNITMTESVSKSEPEYVAEMAYLLSNSASYEVSGGKLENGVVSVDAGAVATVTVTLTLSAQDKSYLNSNFANGMYVEGFLTFDNVEENGIDLNAPFLAFYGDWGEAPIFDLDYYEVETEAHNNAIDEDDKIKADYYATTPTGTYYYDYILPLGSYVYEIDESKYNKIPATEDRAAVSYYADAISGIYGVFTGLLRGAKQISISMVDTSTGKVVWETVKYNCSKAHYEGAPYSYVSLFDIPMANYETGEVFGSNNARYEVTMTAELDWDGGNRNSKDTYSFSFYIDYEAPTVVDATFRTEYDKGKEENRYYVDIMVYDNHYAMSLRPIIIYDFVDENGETMKNYSSLTEYPIPIYQEELGEVTKVTLEITDYIDVIASSANPEGLTLYIDDYAMNGGISFIPFPETESDDLEFTKDGAPVSELSMNINETLDLCELLSHKDQTIPTERDYLKTLTWTSSDESVVRISGGKIEAVGSGSAVINVTGDSWVSTVTDRYGQKTEVPLYKSIVIKVGDTEVDNPMSSGEVEIESLDFVSYDTLFAFNSDIDYSEIGVTGSINYFENDPALSCYPSEQVKLHYSLKPWNLSEDRYTLSWSTSNPSVATVDENGVVTAVAEGFARITLQITIDEKTSILAARCAVNVKSEFIIQNRVLVAYKGNGGEVVIPDDEGIMTIGSFAFCHYNLNNEMAVEKDENGYYDIDLKKEPLGNNTVTSVVIPEGVQTIEKYAFYNCKLLSSVKLPEDCKTIGDYAFANCEMLENVNFENVNVICNYAFYKCDSLTCEARGGVDLSGVYAIGDYAFSGASFDSVTLTTLSRVGKGAFAECPRLSSVVLGERTRIAESMFEKTPVKEIVIYSDTIGDLAFADCDKLERVRIVNDITYLGEEAFINCSALEEIEFDGVCEKIAAFAFYGCTSLKTLELPDCDVVIGDGAFASSALSKLVFGKNTLITEGGANMFDKVKSLTVDVSASDSYKLEGDVLYSKDGSRLVLLLPGASVTSFEVPAGVKEIADGAFSSNTKITSVSFADGSVLERIGLGAFANCTSLKTVTLPGRAITIGDSAFMGTKALKNIDLSLVSKVGDFAFEESGITSVNLLSDGVKVGYGAFYNAGSLKTVALGKGASIDAYAFALSSVQSVTFEGPGATVSEAAFYVCSRLNSFDFENVTGKLGDFAFYGCTSLTSVNAPAITEIGMATFADCHSLEMFSAMNLEIIGDYAFAAYAEESQQGAAIKTFRAPKLKTIGSYAFFACMELRSIDLSSVESIGDTAFALCSALKTVILSESLTEITDFVFYGCSALSEIDLSHVTHIGTCALYSAKLPSELVLPKAVYVGEQAFMQENVGSALVTVKAPELTFLGAQAFGNCTRLENVDMPKLEHMGAGAFAYTAIKEFRVPATIKNIDAIVFEGCESLTAFYAIEDGKRVSDAEFECVMIKDGVLYSVTDIGYVLLCYPVAKTAEEFSVADGTVKIDYCAALGNKSLKRVVLPDTLRYIGNYAFYGCTALDTVVFNSYYAPVLEGNMSGEMLEITPDNAADFPGFDKLYKYDYYYRFEGTVVSPYYYHQFKDVICSTGASGITCVLPKNSEGYDSKLYKAYFTPSETEDSGTVRGAYAWAFIDAVDKLPEVVDRFDEKLVSAAINAFNAIDGNDEEMKFVDQSYVDKFKLARSQYNVSVVENKIDHLFDMDNSKYSFDKLKDAREAYLALTESERNELSNGSVIEEKIADLTKAMGMTPDFTKTYEEHFPEENIEPEPPTAPPANGNDHVKTVIIICSAVAAVAIASAAAILLILRKKRSVSIASGGAALEEYTPEGAENESSEQLNKED